MAMAISVRRAAATTAVLGLALGLAGCGDADPVSEPAAADTSSAATDPADPASYTEQAWLLRFGTAEGGDGELTRAVYVRFTPSTGATTVRALPGLTAPDTYADAQALMVSADHEVALLDSRVARADRRAGRLTLYPTGPGEVRTVDLRALTGVRDLVPVGAAFDPDEGQRLRVVDNQRRVWLVDPVAATAERQDDLPAKDGWIFANGFDKNTGLPFIEDTETTETLPAGNGDDDVRPVEREGGAIWFPDGAPTSDQPAPPCGFAGGFTTAAGALWLFCADTPRIQAYRLERGADAWEKVGVESKAVVPASAEDLPVVLPPVAGD